MVAAVVVSGGASAWFISAPRPAFPPRSANAIGEDGDPARGRLIFAAGDCASCHASPGQTDRLRLGGGLALASPYGTFRVPNISPDPVDGIGNWQSRDLANALLSGVSPGGQHYYPGFPYTSYTHMRLADVKDLMAYLRTLPPVSGRPPPHDLALLFRIRRVLGLWKFLYFKQGPIAPEPPRGEAWNRGRYLVEALLHCAECHSSRSIFGAIEPATRYAGAEDPEGVGYIPNITPANIGAWSNEDIARMLMTGITPDHARLGSSMASVITNTAMLPQSDRDAIATYVKTLPAIPTVKP